MQLFYLAVRLLFLFGTRDSDEELTMGLLLLLFLGRATQIKTGLYCYCCLLWYARISKRLGYETIVVCDARLRIMLSYGTIDFLSFGTCDSEEDWTT